MTAVIREVRQLCIDPGVSPNTMKHYIDTFKFCFQTVWLTPLSLLYSLLDAEFSII